MRRLPGFEYKEDIATGNLEEDLPNSLPGQRISLQAEEITSELQIG